MELPDFLQRENLRGSSLAGGGHSRVVTAERDTRHYKRAIHLQCLRAEPRFEPWAGAYKTPRRSFERRGVFGMTLARTRARRYVWNAREGPAVRVRCASGAVGCHLSPNRTRAAGRFPPFKGE